MKRVLVVLVAVMCTTAFGVVGDSWSLSGDMAIVNGNPNGAWTYHSNGTALDGSVDGSLVGVVNHEVPDAGIGWYNTGANHIMVMKFTVDANPIPPLGTGDDKTNFLIGNVGGHATIGATWTAAEDGVYQIDYLGYNGRNQAEEITLEHERGRTTQLVLNVNGTEEDSVTITGGIEDGYANAYTNSMVVNLLAGQTVILEQQGNEWNGLDMTIEQIPEPATMLLLGLGSLLAIRRKK